MRPTESGTQMKPWNLLKKPTPPHCQPFKKPPPDLIKEAEAIYADKRYKRPEASQYSQEDKEKFTNLFGEEQWDATFGKP